MSFSDFLTFGVTCLPLGDMVNWRGLSCSLPGSWRLGKIQEPGGEGQVAKRQPRQKQATRAQGCRPATSLSSSDPGSRKHPCMMCLPTALSRSPLFYKVCRKNMENGKERKEIKGREKRKTIENQESNSPSSEMQPAACQLDHFAASATSGKWEQKHLPEFVPRAVMTVQ